MTRQERIEDVIALLCFVGVIVMFFAGASMMDERERIRAACPDGTTSIQERETSIDAECRSGIRVSAYRSAP